MNTTNPEMFEPMLFINRLLRTIVVRSSPYSSSQSTCSEGEEAPPEKKCKTTSTRRSLVEMLQAKAEVSKELKVKELELEERRLRLEEKRQEDVVKLEQKRMEQQNQMMALLAAAMNKNNS